MNGRAADGSAPSRACAQGASPTLRDSGGQAAARRVPNGDKQRKAFFTEAQDAPS